MRLRSSEGWNAKSNPDKVLIVPRRAICSAALMRRLSRTVSSSATQHLDRLDGADLAALDLLDEMIERLERPRHAQCDQVAADALDRRVRQGLARHGSGPAAARRRATAS